MAFVIERVEEARCCTRLYVADVVRAQKTFTHSYASFGGLLMRLEGDPRNLHEIKLDERIYLLIRRANN